MYNNQDYTVDSEAPRFAERSYVGDDIPPQRNIRRTYA